MSSEIIGRSGAFTESERQVIGLIAGAVIPEDASLALPGANDPAILTMVLDKVAEQFAERVSAGITELLKEIEPKTLNPEALLDFLEGDARFRSFLQMLTIAIMQGYYQDGRVLESLGLASRPPFPDGHEVESGDWSLLDPVRGRAPFYRPV
jgi:hypothetical protein